MKKFAGLVLSLTGSTVFLWLLWNLFIEETEMFTKIAGLSSQAPYRGLIVFGLVIVLGIRLMFTENEQDEEEEENEFEA